MRQRVKFPTRWRKSLSVSTTGSGSVSTGPTQQVTGAGAHSQLVSFAHAGSGYLPTEGALVHGELFTITGSGFGTRPNFNTESHQWQGHTHLHYRWTDFANGLPPDGSADGVYQSYLGGWLPSASNLATQRVTVENGGPSQSGKYYQKIGIKFADFGGALTADTPSTSIFNTKNGIIAYKFAQTAAGGGKNIRFDKGASGNWWAGRNVAIREGVSGAQYFEPDLDNGAGVFSSVKWITSDPTTKLYLNGSFSRDFSDFLSGSLSWYGVGISNPNSPDTDVVMQIADFMADPTRARVEITSGTKTELQILTSWSDSSIEFAFNKGELSAGAATLRVFNESDTVVFEQAVNVA